MERKGEEGKEIVGDGILVKKNVSNRTFLTLLAKADPTSRWCVCEGRIYIRREREDGS